MALKVNYKDDILNTAQNTKRKYNMINNADGTISLEDVTVYTQEGDNFGAGDINTTNTAINGLNENLIRKMSGTYSEGSYIKVEGIGFDESNKKMLLKVEGADTPIPFSSGVDFAILLSQSLFSSDWTWTSSAKAISVPTQISITENKKYLIIADASARQASATISVALTGLTQLATQTKKGSYSSVQIVYAEGNGTVKATASATATSLNVVLTVIPLE